MANQDNEKWHLPDALRVDLNPELLAQADALQAELRASIGERFQSRSPRDRQLQKAFILAQEYRTIGAPNLTDGQLNELAEALITLGLLDIAAVYVQDPTLAGEIHDLQQALETPDDEDCQCGRQFSHAVREVWNADVQQWITVMRCGNCGLLNAKDIPEHLVKARAARAEVRSKYSGLSPLEAKARMEADRIR